MKSIVFTLLIMMSGVAMAQQEGQFAFTFSNPYLFNPAAGGMYDLIQVESNTRTQWTGYKGGPQGIQLSAHSPVKFNSDKQNTLGSFNESRSALFSNPERTTGRIKHVLGGKVNYEGIGPFTRSSVHGTYAVHIPFSKTTNVGLGIGLGYGSFGINQDRVVLYQNDDQAYSQFLGTTSTQGRLDANAGLVFYGQHLVAGYSTTQALNNSVVFDNIETESFYNRHHFLFGSYALSVGDMIQLEPGVMMKFAPNSPFSADVNLKMTYDKKTWIGAQYRSGNMLVVYLGGNLIGNVYASYAYEMGIGSLSGSSSGTHELQLGIYIGKNRNIEKELKEGAKN